MVDRWEPYSDDGNREGYGEMELFNDGDWVSYDDYKALKDAADELVAATYRGTTNSYVVEAREKYRKATQ